MAHAGTFARRRSLHSLATLVNRVLLSDHPFPTPDAFCGDGRRDQELIVFSLWLLATSAAALATPDVVFAISFSLAVFTTGIHFTSRR